MPVNEGQMFEIDPTVLSPDCATAASRNQDGSITVWSVPERTTILQTLAKAVSDGWGGGIVSMAFSPRDGSLATGNRYGTVELFHVPRRANRGRRRDRSEHEHNDEKPCAHDARKALPASRSGQRALSASSNLSHLISAYVVPPGLAESCNLDEPQS